MKKTFPAIHTKLPEKQLACLWIHKLVTNTYKVTNPSSSKHVKAYTSVSWALLNAINAYRPAYVLKFKISQFLSAIMSLCQKKSAIISSSKPTVPPLQEAQVAEMMHWVK